MKWGALIKLSSQMPSVPLLRNLRPHRRLSLPPLAKSRAAQAGISFLCPGGGWGWEGASLFPGAWLLCMLSSVPGTQPHWVSLPRGGLDITSSPQVCPLPSVPWGLALNVTAPSLLCFWLWLSQQEKPGCLEGGKAGGCDSSVTGEDTEAQRDACVTGEQPEASPALPRGPASPRGGQTSPLLHTWSVFSQ